MNECRADSTTLMGSPVIRYAAPPTLSFRSLSVCFAASVPKPPVAMFRKDLPFAEATSAGFEIPAHPKTVWLVEQPRKKEKELQA